MALERTYVNEIVMEWAGKPREVAEAMIERYGPPDEATESKLIWQGNGPWRRTIVHRDQIPHDFPTPHMDVLQQSIDYRVPPSKFNEIVEFDGSVVPERTGGIVSTCCDSEEANFLALNLMNDIAAGNLTTQAARAVFADTLVALLAGERRPYVQGLQFTVMGDTKDSDIALIQPTEKRQGVRGSSQSSVMG